MMTEKESFIQLKKLDCLLRFGIKDENGNDTGKFLKFNLEQVNYPLKIQECVEMHKKNLQWIKDKLIIIGKQEDKKGKKLLSWKEEEGIKAHEEFYKKEMEALDLFLGQGSTQMILDCYDIEPYYSMFDDIMEMIEPIMPKLQSNAEYLKKKHEDIRKKYSNQEESNVLK